MSWVQILVSGLALGSLYGLLALGYHATYTVSNTVNFSQGASMMLGAVLLYTIDVTWQLGTAAGIVLTLAACAVFGLVLERFAVRPFTREGSIAWLLSTIAVGIILENVVMLTFGKEARRYPSKLADEPWQIFGAGVYPIEIIIPAVGALAALMLYLVRTRTVHGKAMLAVAQNSDAAALMGIDVPGVIAVSYMLSTVLAAIAGIVIAPQLPIAAGMGTIFGLKAFAVAIIGGITSAWGVMIAGVLYGVVESYITAQFGSAFREGLGFALVIVALALMPNGLFGRALVYKV